MIRLLIVPGVRQRQQLEPRLAEYDGVYIDSTGGVLTLTVDGRPFVVSSDFVQDAESLEAFIDAVRTGVIP